MQLQGRARFIGSILIPISVGLGLSALWPVGGLLWWMCFALVTGMLHKFWSFLSMGIIGGILISELQDDEEGVVLDEIQLTIKDMGPLVGKFKDADIHEWIEFADEENVNRAFYVGTVDDESTGGLPEYSIVMPPGIVYQFDMSQAAK
jgi:hypothetical protein